MLLYCYVMSYDPLNININNRMLSMLSSVIITVNAQYDDLLILLSTIYFMIIFIHSLVNLVVFVVMTFLRLLTHIILKWELCNQLVICIYESENDIINYLGIL